jgi:hypothetical protein
MHVKFFPELTDLFPAFLQAVPFLSAALALIDEIGIKANMVATTKADRFTELE